MAAHALLAVQSASESQYRRMPSTSSSTNNEDVYDTLASSSSNSINSASLGLRHKYSTASTSSTLYTYDEGDEDEEEGEEDVHDTAACDEVISDPRLNHNNNNSSGSGSGIRRQENHAIRFKRRNKSSRTSLVTLGEEWLPTMATSTGMLESSTSSTSSSPRATPTGTPAVRRSPRKGHQTSSPSRVSTSIRTTSFSLPPCTCGAIAPSSTSLDDTAADVGSYGEDVENADSNEDSNTIVDTDEQLDKMIRLTSDLLRVSKGVLASSKRIAVAEASLSHTQHSHEHALRQHIEALETQDRFMYFMSSEVNSILNPSKDYAFNPRLSDSSSASALRQSQIISDVQLPALSASQALNASSRSRLRPHASSGSISALPTRATTMYVNAKADGDGTSEALEIEEGNYKGVRDRMPSVTSHSSSISSGVAHPHATEDAGGRQRTSGQEDRPTSTPAQSYGKRSASSALAHLSKYPTTSISSTPSVPTGQSNSRSLVSPGLVSEASSSTPSTFFSSFWSRSSVASSAPSSNASPSTSTSVESSPSLSRLLEGRSANMQKQKQHQHSRSQERDSSPGPRKDAKGILSALAESAAIAKSSSSMVSSPVLQAKPALLATSSNNGAVILNEDTNFSDIEQLATVDPELSRSHGPSLASPPLPPTSIASTASAQVSAIYSSPHLTVSSRIRHRASLSESLLRASWSNNNLKSEKDAVTSKAKSGELAGSPPSHGALGMANKASNSHKRTRHATSPATHLRVQVSNVPFSQHVDRHDRDRDHSA